MPIYRTTMFLLVLLICHVSIFSDSGLIVANRFPIISLNPFDTQDKESREACDLIYAGIIGINTALKNIPEMAHKDTQVLNPRFLDNGKVELIVPLRTDVQWHGTKSGLNIGNFKPEDIIATFRYLKKNSYLPGASKVNNIENILKGGANTIKIIFKPGQFSYRNLNFKILSDKLINLYSKNYGEILDYPETLKNISGSGPYKLHNWNDMTNSMSFSYAANGFLIKPPMIRNVTIEVQHNEQTRARDLFDRNVDLITDLPVKYSSQMKNVSHIKVLDYPSVILTALFFNYRLTKSGKQNVFYNLFRNRNFRRAVVLAIDKKKYYDDIFQEESVFPSITGPFLPGIGAYNSAVTDYCWNNIDFSEMVYDDRLNAAKKMISKYVDKETIQEMNLICKLSDKKMGRLIEKDLENLGLKINTIFIDDFKNKKQYYEKLNKGDFDLALYEWSSGLNPGITMWENREEDKSGVPGNSANFTGYEYSGRYLSEFEKAIHTIKFGRENAEEIKRAYHYIHEQLHQEAAAVFLWNRKVHIAIDRKFQNSLVKDPINFLKSVRDWK